jgi:hypothetical protein
LFRTYLASTGLDTNPCTRPAPCRLLPAALAAVADGGEIWMLDSANYNTATVTIGRSVSILAVPGAVGSILAIGGPAVSIAADNLKVALRNLVIVPLAGGGGTYGVFMSGAFALSIEDSLVANIPLIGVIANGAGSMKITNTTFRNNRNVSVSAQGGGQVTVSGSRILGSGGGGVTAVTELAATSTMSISDSIISGFDSGIAVGALVGGASSRVFVTRCTIENDVTGLSSSTVGVGSALITVSASMITNNGTGWSINGAGSVIKTLGNNHISDNGTNAGVLTPAALQ